MAVLVQHATTDASLASGLLRVLEVVLEELWSVCEMLTWVIFRDWVDAGSLLRTATGLARGFDLRSVEDRFKFRDLLDAQFTASWPIYLDEDGDTEDCYTQKVARNSTAVENSNSCQNSDSSTK